MSAHLDNVWRDLVRRCRETKLYEVPSVDALASEMRSATLLSEPERVSWGEHRAEAASLEAGDDFAAVHVAAREACAAGRHQVAVVLARQSYALAVTGDEKALACNAECGGWDGLGCSSRGLDALRTGLGHAPATMSVRRMLEVNLANMHYIQWALDDAAIIAQRVIEQDIRLEPATRRHRVTTEFAYYVRGHVNRRRMRTQARLVACHAHQALRDLTHARRSYLDLADEFAQPAYGGIANTCHGGIIEVETTLGERSPNAALDELDDGLTRAFDAVDQPIGDWLESYGWWCIFGCNIVQRHLWHDRDFARDYIVRFTKRADRIASLLGNWALRERVLSIAHECGSLSSVWTGNGDDRAGDVELVAGTMARFPTFRTRGSQILESVSPHQDN